MPFTKQIQIGFLKFVPWLFNKTEQLERDVSEAKATADGAMEKAIDAMKVAIEAYETAKKMRPMTEDEVTELFEGIFGKNKK